MPDFDFHGLPGRQAELVSRVWPEGIPTRDRVVLEAVPATGRARTLNRLEAVWRAERGEPLGPLAELAGLGRAAFYNLRVAWRTKSLAGLVPHDTRSGRRVTASDDDPLRLRASAHLRDEPGRRNVEIAKLLMDQDTSLVGDNSGPHDALTVLQRLERLVREERRGLARDPVFLTGAFGQGLVLDLTAVSIVLGGAERELAVVAIIMETASGLILGSALGRKDEGRLLQCNALVAGLDFLRQHKADLPPSRDAAPDLGLMLPSGVDPGRVVEALVAHVDELTVGRVGGFSFGQQVVQVVGSRIGRMPLNPRRTLSFDIEDFMSRRMAPTVTLLEAQAVWAREVDRHNADRIVALVDAGIVYGGLPEGRLAAVVRAILATLQLV